MEVAGAPQSGFISVRTVHLHLTRRCNLRCRHCYSESGPRQTGTLDREQVGRALPLLRAHGYELLSLSGGEPLLYDHLPDLIDAAHDAGLRVTVITNGLVSPARTAAVRARVSGMAVSFDGLEATHDLTRGRTGAYRQALRTVQVLADAGLPVAAAVSLLPGTLPELPDLVNDLTRAGVSAIQVRPVAPAGRARELPELGSAADRARLYWTTLALAREHAPLPVTTDLAPAQVLYVQREAFRELQQGWHAGPLSAAVNPLVVTEAGALKPFTYDFHPRFDLGHLQGLPVVRFAALTELNRLIGRVFDGLSDRFDVLDWYAECAAASHDWNGPTGASPSGSGTVASGSP